jgi:putative phage-type endonuclease
MSKQLSKEWFAQRIGMITGSRVGAILGLSPYQKPEDVMRSMVREKFKAESEFTGNVATQWGNDHEAQAIGDFVMEMSIEVEDCGFIVHPEHTWLGASPDGLTSDGGILEVKCPYSQKIKTLAEQPHYYAQVQMEMYCSGRYHAWFVCWTENKMAIERIDFCQEWINTNIVKLKMFHDYYMEIIEDKKLYSEYLEPLVIDLSDNKEWERACSDMENARFLMTSAKAAEADAKAQMIAIAEHYDKKVSGAGFMAYKASRKGNVDYSRVPELADVDLDGYRKKSTQYWVIK